jgi:hypothetical protein
MTPNVVAVAGIDGLPDHSDPQPNLKTQERNMFSTQGYGSVGYGSLGAANYNLNLQSMMSKKLEEKKAEENGGWWAKQTTGVKAGIVIAGVGVLGAIGYFVYASQKPAAQSYTSNRRRRRARKARKH